MFFKQIFLTLTGCTTPGQSEPGGNSHDRIFHTLILENCSLKRCNSVTYPDKRFFGETFSKGNSQCILSPTEGFSKFESSFHFSIKYRFDLIELNNSVN